jgi:hypothetical protein
LPLRSLHQHRRCHPTRSQPRLRSAIRVRSLHGTLHL